MKCQLKSTLCISINISLYTDGNRIYLKNNKKKSIFFHQFLHNNHRKPVSDYTIEFISRKRFLFSCYCISINVLYYGCVLCRCYVEFYSNMILQQKQHAKMNESSKMENNQTEQTIRYTKS